jgi:hypothetical protein
MEIELRDVVLLEKDFQRQVRLIKIFNYMKWKI